MQRKSRLNHLKEQEQAIACALLGVPEFTEKAGINPNSLNTLNTIATVMGISRERVRQIEAKALRKLRRRIPADLAAERAECLQQGSISPSRATSKYHSAQRREESLCN